MAEEDNKPDYTSNGTSGQPGENYTPGQQTPKETADAIHDLTKKSTDTPLVDPEKLKSFEEQLREMKEEFERRRAKRS